MIWYVSYSQSIDPTNISRNDTEPYFTSKCTTCWTLTWQHMYFTINIINSHDKHDDKDQHWTIDFYLFMKVEHVGKSTMGTLKF